MVARAEFAGSPHAPEWPAGFTWLNTDRPLRLHAELRGRVVVLDFWTYGCINCLHVLPELAALDARFRDEPVTVVGVHSHKYPNEAHPAQIREALLRHDVTHPVIVDEDHQIWDSYGVQAWPTLVVIDPAGYIVATFSGEGHGDELTRLVERLLARGREQGTLVAGPPPGTPEIPHLVIRPLSFPGKVLADRAGGRLFIADTHHHRVLITDWRGEVVGFFGGRRGMVDGPYADVRFTNPQGLLLAGASLYIADTGNHMLRTARLSSFHVETALGDGVIGTDRRGGKTGRDQRLNSPWDLAWLDGRLYLAMAGLHQVWVYDPATGEARVALGTGRESLADGPGRRAALAQPSGLASANGMLYVADAETSAIRQYDPRADLVTTLVGAGLFTFGDRDGPLEDALLQHPLGVAAQGGDLYVADTYNHKIKRIDLRTRVITTIAGTGQPGRDDRGRLALSEPGGLSVSGGDLFIADTNNDRVVHLRLDTGAWRELTLTVHGQPLE